MTSPDTEQPAAEEPTIDEPTIAPSTETDPPALDAGPLVITVPPAGLIFAAPDGRPLFSIGEMGEGDLRQVHAVLYSPAGEPKLVMAAHESGSGVHFLPNSTEATASVGACGEKGFFTAMNPDGTYAVEIGSGYDIGGAVVVWDQTGQFVGAISNAPRRNPVVERTIDLNAFLAMPKVL